MKATRQIKHVISTISALFGFLWNEPLKFLLNWQEFQRTFSERKGASAKWNTIAAFIGLRIVDTVFERLEQLHYQSQLNAVRRPSVPWRGSHFTRGTSSSQASSFAEVEPFRVLHFITNSQPYTVSGYSIRTQAVSKTIMNRGIKLINVTRFGYPLVIGRWPKSAVEKIDGVIHLRIIPWVMPISRKKQHNWTVNKIVEIAHENKINLLHTTTDATNAEVISSAAEVLQVPWVYEVRGEPENTWVASFPEEYREQATNSDAYRQKTKLEKIAHNYADHIITLSRVSRDKLVGEGIPQSKISIIPNAVDDQVLQYSLTKTEARERLNLPSGLIVGAITSIVKYEGLDVLLRAIQSLPELTFLIVGDGSELPNLKVLAHELDVEDRVIFAGKRPNGEILDWYRSIDVFVVPRIDTEVCRSVTPLKSVTAQAMGIPIVCSDLPALREVTGGLAEYVKPNDPSSLACGIQKVLGTNPQVNQEWLESHLWSTNGKLYEEAYRFALLNYRH